MPRLCLPSVKYKKGFLQNFLGSRNKPDLAINSWGKYSEKRFLMKNFKAFVKFIRSQRKGENLPKGYIPHTIFWLVDGNRLLGVLSLRHKLTPYLRKFGGHIGYEITPKFRGKGYGKLILKLGLKKAHTLGLGRVLLTCDAANLRSKKVIESNGGKYEGKSPHGKGKPYKLRYWIKT